MHYLKYSTHIVAGICIFFLFFYGTTYIFVSAQIEEKPARHFRILIVPGHEPQSGGAEFRTLAERDMASAVGHKVKDLLDSNPFYTTYITRNSFMWDPLFARYFATQEQAIVSWKNISRQDELAFVSLGLQPNLSTFVRHGSASPDGAVRLYGITKWANENNIDLVIHMHFDDDSKHRKNVAGKRSGFTVYVPPVGYNGALQSQRFGQILARYLLQHSNINSLLSKSNGVVEDNRLIATGAHNTLEVPSVLVEYGYIYEGRFQSDSDRERAFNEIASSTYRAVNEFFSNY